MPYGLYISAEGAHAQSLRLDVIANNLANVDTVGFKRELAVCQARYAQAIEDGQAMPGDGSINNIGGGIMVRETKTDYSMGSLQDTGRKTDVAITNQDGFFMVRKGDENFLTRAGNFQVTGDGRLVTVQGYDVLNAAGGPIALNPYDMASLSIDPSGTVRQDGMVQSLALVRPESLADLVRVGENLFKPLSEPQPLEPSQRAVASGYLEKSSVSPTFEMTEMVKAARLLEANVNMMKTQDEMLAGLVNRVLRVR